MVVRATPGRMVGLAPTSWDLPGGRRIRIDVDRASVLSGMGLYRADMAFTAGFIGTADQIGCGTEPAGPAVPETRFGCWGEGVAFWIAPDQGCSARDAANVETLTTAACWNGQLRTGRRRIDLRHATLAATGSPVGYVTWMDEQDRVLLTADIVSTFQIRFYRLAGGRPSAMTRKLLLLTVALAWWEHAS
jgi:hypothetical protein